MQKLADFSDRTGRIYIRRLKGSSAAKFRLVAAELSHSAGGYRIAALGRVRYFLRDRPQASPALALTNS